MPLEFRFCDITEIKADVIVNAANERLYPGGGVSGAIFCAAGPALEEECRKIGFCPTGSAVLTGGYDTWAKYIVHAVGPVWHGGSHGEEALLKSAYVSALKLAEEKKAKSIAFPLISSGLYGYPQEAAKLAAEEAITDYLEENDSEMLVLLVLFSVRLMDLISPEILNEVEGLRRLLKKAIETERLKGGRFRDLRQFPANDETAKLLAPELFEEDLSAGKALAAASSEKGENEPYNREKLLESLGNKEKKTARDETIKFIDSMIKKHCKDKASVCYKAANISKQQFSRLMGGERNFSRNTLLALCLGLRLDERESRQFLEKSGYVFTDDIPDRLVLYFVKRREEYVRSSLGKRLPILEVNEILEAYGMPQLGGRG